MSVKITLEFKGVDEAIVALAKLTAVKAAAVTPPVQLLLAASEATPPTAAEAPKRTRKPRSDAGKERGSYKDAKGAGATSPSTQLVSEPTTAAGSAPATPVAPAPAAPQPAAQEEPKSVAVGQHVPPAPAAAGPVSDEEVQKAVEKIFGAKGYDDTLALLSRFGVKRGKEIRQDMRADFLKRVDAVIAGEAI